MTEKTFCELLDEMIADEEKAPLDYEKIQKNKPLIGLEGQIMLSLLIVSIQKDERKHAELLKEVKKEICL